MTIVANCEVINTGLLGASLNDIENLFFSNLKIYKPNYIILLSNHNSAHYDSFAKGHKKPNLLEISYSSEMIKDKINKHFNECFIDNIKFKRSLHC